MKALFALIAFGILNLFCGFVYGTPELEQLSGCMLILALVLFTPPKSYSRIIAEGYLLGAAFEFIDEVFKLNDKLRIEDFYFTPIWMGIVAFRLYKLYNHGRNKKRGDSISR